MKILHVIDNMGMGGAQSFVVELAPIQKKQNNTVDVLELKESKDKTLIKKLEKEGICVNALSQSRSVRNPLNIFSLIPYLNRYDIVHVHLFPANYWVPLAKKVSLSKTPIVTTEHSTFNKRRNIPLFKIIDKWIYKMYNQVIACADKAQETFNKHYKDISCVSIPNGINIKKYTDAIPYSKQELLGINEDCFVMTMVARFIPSKRQDTLIHSLTFLPNNCHVVLVGGSESDERLIEIKELARSLGVIERVHFLYTRSDVDRILKTSNVVIMSSEYEGLSLSSIEGMASGRPFIASDVNGLREVVSGAGILVECANAKDLADNIIKLINDSEYNISVAQKCVSRAMEYDIYNVSNKYLSEYNKYLL